MISRRPLRIRSFQFLFSYFKQTPTPSVEMIKRQCFQSFDKTYNFYLMFLSLLDEFRILELNELDKQKTKYIKKAEVWTPVFSNHPFLLALKEHKAFYQILQHRQVNFGKDPDWIISVYKNLKQEAFYKEYVQKKEFSREASMLFLEQVVGDYLYNNELVEHFFEEESMFPSDDLFISLNIVHKNIEEFEKNNSFFVLPMFKDEEKDRKFVEELLEYTVQQYFNFDTYIAKYSKNWELERINFSDLLLLKMCLVELIYMPDIPLKTSVDEYLEISKEYSTPQSYVFINGLLVGLIDHLQKNDLIKKSV